MIHMMPGVQNMRVTIDGVEYVPAPFRPGTMLPVRTIMLQARRTRKMTYRAVSEATWLAQSTICRAETTSTMTLATAIKLCRFYQIDLDTLADSVMAFDEEKKK